MTDTKTDTRDGGTGGEAEPTPIEGIHHVTAIASDPQRNLDFYTRVLGLRLVKRTVNFDDPGTYHLYFGDGLGRPGSILTFFPWPQARRGVRGTGQATVTSFSVPAGSLGFWADRLAGFEVPAEEPHERFDEEVLTFLDPDGLKLELVAHEGAEAVEPWEGEVAGEHAIRRFHGVTLSVADAEPTSRLLEAGMGFRKTGESGRRQRFETGPGGASAIVDAVPQSGGERGRVAAGSVHHVAFRAADDSQQLAWRQRLLESGQEVTPVVDRQYFHSVYFREPGGVLFELATDPPGFTTDESPEELGSDLRLPPWLEGRRDAIESALPRLTVGEGGGHA